MVGTTGSGKGDDWSIMEIKPLERMRAGRVAREVQESTIILGRRTGDRLRELAGSRSGTNSLVSSTAQSTGGIESNSDRVAELEAENKRLKANLDKAVKLNEKMWSGIVDLRLAEHPNTG